MSDAPESPLPAKAARHPTEERRRAIAAAARDLIVEKGFEALRTRDIAERVGINIATLHYHVPTKAALVALVAKSLKDDFIAEQERAPREGLSPLARLRLEFDDFARRERENPALMQVMSELTRLSRTDPEIAAEIGPMRAHWRASLTALFAEGRESGEFRTDIVPEAAARITIATLVSLHLNPDRTGTDIPAACGELIRCFAARRDMP